MNFPIQLGVTADALLGGDGDRYRYWLTRIWNPSLPLALFAMLNASTGDARKDDPTLRKDQTYARLWGYGGIAVVNLHAYRTPSPKELLSYNGDSVGPLNDYWIRYWAAQSEIVICGWGANGSYRNRGEVVLALLRAAHPRVRCLRMTKSGFPEHPLYLPFNLVPMEIPIEE